jgi:hypothetical protein
MRPRSVRGRLHFSIIVVPREAVLASLGRQKFADFCAAIVLNSSGTSADSTVTARTR